MKKLLSLAATVLCVLMSVEAQDIVNLRMDRQQLGLRGSVATLDQDIMLRKDYFREDWPERKWFKKDLRSVLREENGQVMTFNKEGRMTSITYTYQGKAGEKTTCSYASNGLLTSFVGEGYKVEARYQGNSADINVYAETRSYSSKVDVAKDNLKTAPYSHTYPFDLKCRQELSDEGLVLESRYYYVDSMPAKVCHYDYNHRGFLIGERISEYGADGELTTTIVRYTYDNRDFLIEKTIHSAAVDETYSYENNNYGDCVKLTLERPYGTTVYTYDYEYDTMGNWTVRLQFDDGVFNNAVLRTLTYHKEPTAQEKEQALAKQAAKEQKEQARKAEQEAKAREKAALKEQKEREEAAMKNMTAEERKAYKAQLAAQKKADKERADAAKKAEKERIAAEKKAAKEQADAAKKAEKERIAAEKKAAKEQAAAAKKAEKEAAKAQKKQK